MHSRLEHALLRCLSWSKLLPSSWSGLRDFYASSFHFIWEKLSTFITYSDMEGPRDSSHFKELPGSILNCLPFWLRNFLMVWNILTSKETIPQQWQVGKGWIVLISFNLTESRNRCKESSIELSWSNWLVSMSVRIFMISQHRKIHLECEQHHLLGWTLSYIRVKKVSWLYKQERDNGAFMLSALDRRCEISRRLSSALNSPKWWWVTLNSPFPALTLLDWGVWL